MKLEHLASDEFSNFDSDAERLWRIVKNVEDCEPTTM